jgi:hypothetical protein
MIECNCCFEKRKPEAVIACRNGHVMCKSCLRRYVATSLGSRKEVTCPDQSSETFPETSLMSTLLPSQKVAYDKLQAELALRDVKGLENCIKCSFSFIKESDSGPLICPVCGFISCKNCHKPEHLGSCNDRHPDHHHTIAEAETYKRIISCTCGAEFIKDGGCNHMTCNRCKKEWCWICKAVWSPGHRCQVSPVSRINSRIRPRPRTFPRPRSNLCSGVFKSGIPCRFRAKVGNRCRIHRV